MSFPDLPHPALTLLYWTHTADFVILFVTDNTEGPKYMLLDFLNHRGPALDSFRRTMIFFFKIK